MENEKVPSSFFLLVGGAFVILYFIISALSGGHHGSSGHGGSSKHENTIDGRTAPVGQVAIADPNAPVETTTAVAAASGGSDGKSIYDATCAICHDAGVAGAPKVGDIENWVPRIDQGDDALYDHAINGFMGAGMMPAKGGNAALTDDEVKAAVDYMVTNSK